jgi:hypothetical protein
MKAGAHVAVTGAKGKAENPKTAGETPSISVNFRKG